MNRENYWFFREDHYQKTQIKGTVAFHFSTKHPEVPGISFTEYLIPSDSIIRINSNTSISIIPIEGEMAISADSINPASIYPGEIISYSSNKAITLTSSKNQEWTRCYVIELPSSSSVESETRTYSLEKNAFTRLSISKEINLLIGYFGNRMEGELRVEKGNFELLTIHGVFECQERLLKTRELLIGENVSSFGYESLLENTVVLAFEF